MNPMKSNAVSFDAYKAAADRIRRGCARMGDAAICDRYDAYMTEKNRKVCKSIMDLPMAAGMWNESTNRGD